MIALPSNLHALLSRLPDCVLLESSRPDAENSHSYVFSDSVELLTAKTLDDLAGLFERIEDALAHGLYAAGFMSYECGYHFEPRAATHPPERSSLPLAWFGLYRRPCVFDHDRGTFLPGLPPAWRDAVASAPRLRECAVSTPRLEIARDEYGAKIEAIRDFIAEGDTYQVNFTTKARFDYSGPPATLYSTLRDQQRVGFSAFIQAGEHHVLSFSPELFFRIHNGRILTRPMKGTARRGRTLAEDARIRNWLRNDPKNRSENVMIVDLLRNDIGKIAETGSVRVDRLFAIERYETLFQMTSTVSGVLRSGICFSDIFRAMFPSGSVTGAPKLRTMQIIQELELGARGVYTGAIGFISPDRDAVFSVAIRTLVLESASGEMGVGGGIVYDSVPLDEYAECQLKMQFLAGSRARFHLIETLLWDGRYHFLEEHVDRLTNSAAYFDFPFSESDVKAKLQEAADRLRDGESYKVRLWLDSAGTMRIEGARLEPEPPSATVTLSSERVASHDRFLFHKTTRRDLYERQFSEARRQGHADILFLNEKGQLTEAANNNVFIGIAGHLFTPPLECGLLPGVFRQQLLATDPRASQRILSVKDLESADALYLCNSVRGLRKVSLV